MRGQSDCLADRRPLNQPFTLIRPPATFSLKREKEQSRPRLAKRLVSFYGNLLTDDDSLKTIHLK